MQKKRIRVDIVSTKSHPSKDPLNDVLQLTVTDTGCGMENIQKCVNAFQTSKDGKATKNRDQQNANNNFSGRYGIGLTLCLLHAQATCADKFYVTLLALKHMHTRYQSAVSLRHPKCFCSSAVLRV